MSVYTCITRPQLVQFFSAYALGEIISFEGIKDGIDNTNYWVDTTEGGFVLTLFESLAANEVPHFLNLLAHLGKNGLPCPSPQSDRHSNLLRELNGKPAAVFKRLSGVATASPSILHCQEIGLNLARLHHCTRGYVFPLKKCSDLIWCKTVLDKINAFLPKEDRRLVIDELNFQAENCRANLPQGVIHADLFRDNVFFVDGRFSGMLDFYNACTDALLFDIAVTANDWCYEDGMANNEKYSALLSAYESLRPLGEVEKNHWPIMLRAAALRFWLSRMERQCYPRPGEMTRQKDPLVFRRILLQHRQLVWAV